MTEKSTTEYLKQLETLKLSESSKTRMRQELSAFADFHAVRVAEDVRSIEKVQSNSVFTLFTTTYTRIMKATLLIALLVGTGGTSFAAQGAVPGDLLYPVKVHVNETVRSAFAVSANAEAELQAQLLGERLEEAQKLAARGELEGEVASDAQMHITDQFQKTLAANAEADVQTQAAVRTSVTQALATFNADLQAMRSSSVESDVVADYSSAITAKINALLGADANSSLGIEIAGDADAATVISNAEARIQGLTTALADTAALSAQAKAEFEADVETAVTKVTEAQASLQANAEAQAKAQAENALEIIGEIESALSSYGEVEIDSATGSIIDINASGTSSAEGEASAAGIEAAAEGAAGASLENDMIGTQLESESGVTGSLGL